MITEKFHTLFQFQKKSRLKASDGNIEGKYPFLTSSLKVTKRTDNPLYFETSLVFGNGGRANIHFLEEPFSTTSHCYIVTKKHDGINLKYVYYYLAGNLHLLERGFKGAGLKNISSKYIANLDIPILPIETQNKIVALLDKASALVQKRENSIAQLDELLRAQFLEIFGDPVMANKHNSIELKYYLKKIQIGPFGSQLHRKDYIKDGIPLVNPVNIVDTIIIPDNEITLTKEKYNSLPNYHLNKGDIIMARRGEMGRCGLITEVENNWFCGTGSLYLRPKNIEHSIFLLLALTEVNTIEYLNRNAKGVTMKNLNKTIISNIPIIKCEDGLILKFNKIYHNIQAQKETLAQSKTELENLYNSLLQLAFKGSLNITKEEAKKEFIMPKIDTNKTEKRDITNLDLATYYGIPEEELTTREKWMFDFVGDDVFYQFLLKDTFTKEEVFTLGDIEKKLYDFFYQEGDIDFDNAKWQEIIFKFLKADKPLLEQIFEEETATVKLKLTDETFKA